MDFSDVSFNQISRDALGDNAELGLESGVESKISCCRFHFNYSTRDQLIFANISLFLLNFVKFHTFEASAAFSVVGVIANVSLLDYKFMTIGVHKFNLWKIPSLELPNNFH